MKHLWEYSMCGRLFFQVNKLLGKDLLEPAILQSYTGCLTKGLDVLTSKQCSVSLASQPVFSRSSFLREPSSIWFWHFKIYVTVLWVRVWANFYQNLNPFDSGFITIFSNSRTSGSNSFTHYIFPNAKDYVSTKF